MKFTDLSRVNLITGKNNVGKTALLEALFIHGGAHNPELTIRVNAFRGIEEVKVELKGEETPWDMIFNKLDISKTISLKGISEKGSFREIRLKVVRNPTELMNVIKLISQSMSEEERKSFNPSLDAAHVLELECKEDENEKSYYMTIGIRGGGLFPLPDPASYQTIFVPARRKPPGADEDANRLGSLERVGKEGVVLDTLRVIEKRLKNITVIVRGRRREKMSAMIYGDVGITKKLPLPAMGEGMVRLSSLILALGAARDGVVLVDEIENGLHYSVMKEVWQQIAETAREFNTQVFATTHSLECIKAAHRAFSESKIYDFRLHRLERIDEHIQSVTYNQNTLESAIETELEVR